MNARISTAALIGLALILAAGPLLAASYKYTDADGVVHYTDNPYELPEPQRTRVLKKLEKERLEREQNPPAEPPAQNQGHDRLPPGPIAPAAGPSGPDPRVDHGTDAPAIGDENSESGKKTKAFWQGELKQAKAEIAKLQDTCAKLESERDANHRKSLIFATPGSAQATVEAERKLKTCQKKLEEARRYLDEGLPEKARRAGAPPGWIRD